LPLDYQATTTPCPLITAAATPTKMQSYLLQPTSTNLVKQNNSHLQQQTINLNSFGRSSTLDRKLKPLSLINERCFGNNANKIPQVDSINNSYLTNFAYHQQLVDTTSVMQRNSLNLQLKSPNHSQGQYNNGSNSLLRNGSFLRRPLSQENSELTNQNAQVYQQSQLNELEKNQHIFNINSHVLALTNQLNHSVSFIARFKIKNHDFFGAIKYQTMESFK
jgi:hypothetical protein